MKLVLRGLLSIGLVLSLTACGGDNDSGDEAVASLATSDTTTAKSDDKVALSNPGPFSKGDFGEITLSQGYVIPLDAVFIDIRNEWERKVNPKGSVRATYEIRAVGADGKEDKSIKRKMNENFVSDVLNLPAVAHDRNKHIILICASGSRSGAHGEKTKDSAAKLLSDNGFTYVEHIKHGMWDPEGWMDKKLPYVQQ
jgi:rhodanese-related sulfurtransferase